MEVVEPPYIAPEYIEASMMSALTGFMLSTMGSSIASAPAGPIPGRTPMMVPRNAPIKANIRL